MLTGVRRGGAVVGLALPLLLPLSSAGAACAPAAATGDLVDVVAPPGVPVSPVDVGSSSAEQELPGTDDTSSNVSDGSVPLQVLSLANGTAVTRASATVADALSARGSATAERVSLTFPATFPLPAPSPITLVGLEARATAGGAPEAVSSVASLRVGMTTIPVGTTPLVIPVPGVGTLYLNERGTTGTGDQSTASATVARLALDDGGSVRIAAATARTGC